MTEDEEEAALEARYCGCAEFKPGADTCPETGMPLCVACAKWRPEYITCVGVDAARFTAVKSVCGRSCFVSEFVFMDWAHADGNEARGGRLVTCAACKAARNK